MNTLRSLVLAVVSCLSALVAAAQTTLAPAEFQKKLAATPTPQVLDVRTPDEYKGGHLADAHNIDFYRKDFATAVTRLDKSKPVFVYCLGGGRSADAASILAKAGYTVYDMDGGMRAWKDKGLPVEKAEVNTAKAKVWTQAEVEAVIASGKTAVIDFGAPWCAPCRKMEPSLNQLEKDGVHVSRIDYDANRAIAMQYGVESIPTLLVVKKGKIALRMEGLQTLERLREVTR